MSFSQNLSHIKGRGECLISNMAKYAKITFTKSIHNAVIHVDYTICGSIKAFSFKYACKQRQINSVSDARIYIKIDQMLMCFLLVT